jgi:hypothetical protein
MDESCQYSHVPAHAVMISDSERSMLILRLQLIYPLNFHLLNICFQFVSLICVITAGQEPNCRCGPKQAAVLTDSFLLWRID